MLIEPEQPFHYLQQTRQSQSTFFPVRDTKKKRRKRRQRDFIESINPFTGVPAGFYRAYAMSSPIQLATSTVQDTVQEGEERMQSLENKVEHKRNLLGDDPNFMSPERMGTTLPIGQHADFVSALLRSNSKAFLLNYRNEIRNNRSTPAQRGLFPSTPAKDPNAQGVSPSLRTPMIPEALDPGQRQAGLRGRTEGFYEGQQ